MADPWMKFYPSNWRQDPQLRMCSLAARGLWIEMIALMHQATPYGHLLVSGHIPTDAQLAMLVGCTPAEVSALIGELEAAGVFSRTRTGAIYSRRMTRTHKKAATARNNGRKGGNPNLSKQKEKTALVNQGVKGRDKPQKPEARSQSKEIDKSISRSFDEFWGQWPNKVAKGAAQSAWRKLSQADREAALSALVSGWFEKWRASKPDANPIHPASFLNQQRWLDEFQPQFMTINGGFHEGLDHQGRADRGRSQAGQRPDPALEQIARLARVGQTSGNGGF